MAASEHEESPFPSADRALTERSANGSRPARASACPACRGDPIDLPSRAAAWSLVRAIESRDVETREHMERMSRYCVLIASGLGGGTEECERIRLASLLHDIGKIALPDEILFKESGLTWREREIVERHAAIGYEILAHCGSTLLDLAATIAWTHHERVDGKGYPRGLGGDEIPLVGRIAAVADVFDALTSERPYRPAYPLGLALDALHAGRGSHFDARVVDRFLALLHVTSAAERRCEESLPDGPHLERATLEPVGSAPRARR